MSVRRILAIFAVALAVAWAGYTAYWFHAQGVLRKGLERWAEARRADGWTVDWAGLEDGGYPARLRVVLAEPALFSPPDRMGWRAGHLTIEADPLDWTRIHLEAAGGHVLDGPLGRLELQAGSARADVNLDRRGTLEDATLLLSGVTVPVDGDTLSLDGLGVTWDPLPPATPAPDHTQATLRFSATGHGIRLPDLPGLPLDRTITLAEITGRMMGPLPGGPPAAALAAWSADGGTLEIEHVSLDWAPMALEGDGTLALDPNGQVVAAMATQIRGFAPLMDRLAETRAVDPRAAQAAKIVLMLMAKPDSKGRPAVPVPVTVQDNTLALGPAVVARFPALQWPALQ